MRRIEMASLILFLAAGGPLACDDVITTVGQTGITGTARDIYWSKDGDVVIPNSTSTWSKIEAIADKVYPGTIDENGNIDIPNVPMGPYMLTLTHVVTDPMFSGAQPLKDIFITDARQIDLDRRYAYRYGLQPVTPESSKLVVNVTLSEPWNGVKEDPSGYIVENGDTFRIFSRSTSIDRGYHFADPAGSLQFSPSVLLDRSWSVVDAGLGDDFMVMREVEKQVDNQAPLDDPWHELTYRSVVEAFEPAPFTMTNGGTTEISGAFKAAEQRNFAVDFKGSAFNTSMVDVPAHIILASFGVDVLTGTQKPADGAIAPLWNVTTGTGAVYSNPELACQGASCIPELCSSSCDQGTIEGPGDHVFTYSYGNPFAEGQEMAWASVGFTFYPPPLPPDDSKEPLRGWMDIVAPAAELDGQAIRPVVGLPQNIRVAGKTTPYDTVTSGVGATPTIEWDPPSIGKPTSYMVRVIDLTDVSGPNGVDTFRRPVANIWLTNTSVTIPAGILKPGKNYSFQVAAQLKDEDDLAKPFWWSMHSAISVMFTGAVTP